MKRAKKRKFKVPKNCLAVWICYRCKKLTKKNPRKAKITAKNSSRKWWIKKS